MKRNFFLLAAVVFSSHLQAQDSSGRVLDEAVVTANKFEQKQSQTGKVVTVITRQQLEKSSGKNLAEVLSSVAGMTIIGADNNAGTNFTTSIRGGTAGNTLLLINGIPVNDASVNTNYFDLNYFSIDQVERIEILKGGQSTLYGSDAVSGVVNIILKKAVREKLAVNGTLTAGSYGSFRQSVGLQGKFNQGSLLLDYTHISATGFSAALDTTSAKGYDKDGFRQHIVNGRYSVPLSSKLTWDTWGTFAHYFTDLDAGAFIDEKDYTVKSDNVQAGTGLQYVHSGGRLHFNYHFNYLEREYKDDSGYQASPFTSFSRQRYIGRTHYAELYDNWGRGPWQWLAGADLRFSNTSQYYYSLGSFGPYDPGPWQGNMTQVAPYFSAIYKYRALTTEAGGRFNVHSRYGNNFTFSFNPSLLLPHGLKIFGNLYSAFKAPTLYQLFDPSAGNKDLTPEKSTIAEAGVAVTVPQKFFGRIVGFYRNTRDAIVYTSDPLTYESKYLNADRQELYGVEAEGTVTVGVLSLAVNYTFTDGKLKTGYDNTGMELAKDSSYYNLYRIPKNALNLTLGVQCTNKFYMSAYLHAVGKRQEYVYAGVPKPLDAYATVDLYAEYKGAKQWRVFVDLKNITNKLYYDFPGYTTKRFNVNGGISFTLK